MREKLSKKVAIISGVTGQDGSHLAEHLLNLGYLVIGLKRRTSNICTDRIDHILDDDNFVLRYYSLFDPCTTYRLISQYNPDEIYNLAAQTHVKVSFETPVETVNSIVNGTLYWLEAIRLYKDNFGKNIKFYQASSSEMFGRNIEAPQNEETKFAPASPYACAKVCAHYLVQNYRESYGLFACSGILFNHEGPRRGETFVTRKVTIGVARIKMGLQSFMELGNLESKRDWGYAGDYVSAMHKMLQQNKADDFVISTGETHTVREWVEEVFSVAGMPITWEGEGLSEVGKSNGRVVVKINSKYFRPEEVPLLLGDSSKAQHQLGWLPEVTFKSLAKMMYEADFNNIQVNKNSSTEE